MITAVAHNIKWMLGCENLPIWLRPYGSTKRWRRVQTHNKLDWNGFFFNSMGFQLMRVFHVKRQYCDGLTTMFMIALKQITLKKRPFNLSRVKEPINQSYEMEKDDAEEREASYDNWAFALSNKRSQSNVEFMFDLLADVLRRFLYSSVKWTNWIEKSSD